MKIKTKAFTLVEILIVIVIIAILAAMLLAALGAAQEKAKEKATKTAMKGFLTTFVEVYTNDPEWAVDFLLTDTDNGTDDRPDDGISGSGDSADDSRCTDTAIVPVDGSQFNDDKYIEFLEKGKYGSEKSLTDSWGEKYKFNLDITNGEISIKSYGIDGTDGSSDDIVFKQTL